MGLPSWAARMTRWSPPSLTTGMLLACATGLTVAFVALCGFLALETGRDAARQADATATRLAAAVAQDVGRNVELFDLTLQAAIALLQSPAIKGLGPEQRYLVLFAGMLRDRYVAFVDVLDENGDVTAGSPAAEHPSNWAARDYFVVQRASPGNSIYIGRPFATAQEEYAGIPISRRLSGADGGFAGVVVIGLRLAYFRDLFSRLGLGPDWSVALLRNDGVVLMRLPFDRNDIGRTLDAAAPSGYFARSGSPSVAAVDPIDHVQRQFAFRRVGTLPLLVSVGVAGEEIYRGWRFRVLLFAAAGAALVAAGVLLIARLWREQRRREAAEQAGQEKSRYLATLSHELRTPLQGVLGYADQLTRHSGLTPGQSAQVAEIVAAGKHMRDVVNQVLDCARIEARGPALHMSRVDVRALLEECLGLIEPGAKARNLATKLTVAPDAPGHFVTDGVQLRQILMNLLSNAVKYTPRGGIELRLMGTEEQLRIEVADTGIGIPEGRRHRLFKEYERFGVEQTRIEGTGLGLAIAHRLAMRMGGHLGHRENVGSGSVFGLALPSGVADAPTAVTDDARAPSRRRLRILVVDDSEVTRNVTMSFLEQAGHATIDAHDGLEAVRLAATGDFDLVLMDMRMHGMDGLEATKQIRTLAGSRGQVPIVAMTANALDQHAEECRRAGMIEHLAKPVTQAELLAVVNRVTAAAPRVELPVVDVDIMAQLSSCMSSDEVNWLLDCLTLRIEAMVKKLGEPDPFGASGGLAELAHEMAGSAGTLGFARLSAAAARFDRALTADPVLAPRMVEEIVFEANAALAELRRARSAVSRLFA
jgi:signal transduction histidine kinase/CheY-like chemotaxis protein/HPt (histidine-containing phosphotransfer) domain-containing protein